MTRIGQVVIYKLTENDKEVLRSINRVGGTVNQSEVLPAIVVADWGGCVNLSVVLDGNHAPIWKTSVCFLQNKFPYQKVTVQESR